MKIEKDVLSLTGLSIQCLTEQEKKGLKRVRDGYENEAEKVLSALLKNPTTLSVPSVDFGATLQEVKEAKQILDAMAWLEEKREALEDTLRWKQDGIKKTMDLLSDVAKPLSTHDRELATIFASYWDFSSEPSKKAAQTRRKKKE